MIDLTKEAFWGLYTLQYLAQKKSAASRKELARYGGLAERTLAPILRKLQEAGLILASPGHGYRLQKPGGLISVEEVKILFQPAGAPANPCTSTYDACAFRESCPLSPLCREVHVRAQEAMRSFSIADLKEAAPEVADCAAGGKKRPRSATG